MRNVFKITIICLLTLLYSCDNEEDQIIGDCSNPPKLSAEKLIFDKKGGTQEVTINQKYRFGLNYNNKDINTYDESNDLKIVRGKNFTTYEHTDFTIKTYELKVVVIMNENNSTPRNLAISTNSGNCFTGFTVEQKGI